jgi:transposase-like protein
VLEEVKAWQTRPLDPLYPIVYIDALVVKVRDGHQVRNKAAHLAVGVDGYRPGLSEVSERSPESRRGAFLSSCGSSRAGSRFRGRKGSANP